MRSVLLHSFAQILLAEVGSKGVFFRYCFLGVIGQDGVLGGILGAMAMAPNLTFFFNVKHCKGKRA